MKRFFLPLTIVFTIFAAGLQAQDDVYFKPEPKYPKGSTKISIETGKSKADNFELCSQFLTNLDISTEANEKTMVIKTDELNTKKKRYPYYLTFFCKDSVIVLTGKFKTGMTIQIYGVRSEDNFEPIINKGMKGSPLQITFSEMLGVAQSFNYPVSFNN